MSHIGRFFFSKLVLPAIAVQAKETDIEHHNTGSQPVEKLGLGTSGVGHDAAPAYRRAQSPVPRSHHSPSHHSHDDRLLQDLLAFRAWQSQQSRGVVSPRPGKNFTNMSPVSHGEMRQRPVNMNNARNASSPHSPSIIVISGDNSNNMMPSNLSATHEPVLAAVDMNQSNTQHNPPRIASVESPGPHGLATIGEEKPVDTRFDADKSYNQHVAVDINDSFPKTAQNHEATPSDSINTVEQTTVVQTVEDGVVIDKFVTTNVRYSNTELYIAATQFYHRLLAELLGTWAVTFFIAGLCIESSLGHINQMGVAIGSGLIFVALIYSLGQVSGAHFNPVVTFAFVLRGMFPLTWLPFYWVVQFVGALLAAAMLLGFYREEQGQFGATIVPAGRSEQSSFFMETVLTFVLVFTILSMASRSKIVGPHAALAIGSVIALNIMLAGSYSGASMNPFRSVAISVVFPVTFYSVWVFFAGPFFGSFCAVIAVFLLAGRPRNDELTAGIGATIAVAISNQLSRTVHEDGDDSHVT